MKKIIINPEKQTTTEGQILTLCIAVIAALAGVGLIVWESML